MQTVKVELDEEGVGAGGLCLVHAPRPAPVRWYLQLANEARHLGLHALADWYMRLAHVSAGS